MQNSSTMLLALFGFAGFYDLYRLADAQRLHTDRLAIDPAAKASNDKVRT